jgi:hypothetical protein
MGVCRTTSQVGCNWAPCKGCCYEFSPPFPIFIETPNLQLSLQPPLPPHKFDAPKHCHTSPELGGPIHVDLHHHRSPHSRIGKWCIPTALPLQTCSQPQVGLQADFWPGRLRSTECNGVLPMSNWWLLFCMAGGRGREMLSNVLFREAASSLGSARPRFSNVFCSLVSFLRSLGELCAEWLCKIQIFATILFD